MELGSELISGRGELIFARKRVKKRCGVFFSSRFEGAFSRFGGLFVFGGVFSRDAAIYIARSAKLFCSFKKNILFKKKKTFFFFFFSKNNKFSLWS